MAARSRFLHMTGTSPPHVERLSFRVALASEPEALERYREQLQGSYHITTMALADYEPVVGNQDEKASLDSLRGEIDRFHTTLLEVLVRGLSQLLHPAALDDLGLPAVIDASLRGLARRHNIRGRLHQVNLPDRMPREVELAAYRIVQEALTNIAKHAQATECEVRLTQLSDCLLVEVEDNGVGFIEDTDRPIVARGLGLVSVRERAVRLGGTFNVLSAPGEGTLVTVGLPEPGGALA